MWSTLAAIFACSAGFRYWIAATRTPRRIFVVSRASAARSVHASRQLRSGVPPGPPKKWSLTQNESNPDFSASRATSQISWYDHPAAGETMTPSFTAPMLVGLAARDLPVVRHDVDPRLALIEKDLLARRVLEHEGVGVARARPRRFLTETVAEDRGGAAAGEAHVVREGARRVDDLRDFPDLGVDDRDIRRRDRLVIDRVHVAHGLARVVLEPRVRPCLRVVLVFHERDVLAIRNGDVRRRDSAGHARDHRDVIGRCEESPGR